MSAASWIVFAVVAGAAGAPLQVTGASTCPSPADVEAAVAGLIEPDTRGQAADVVTLSDAGGVLVVNLRRVERHHRGAGRHHRARFLTPGRHAGAGPGRALRRHAHQRPRPGQRHVAALRAGGDGRVAAHLDRDLAGGAGWPGADAAPDL